MSLDLHKPKNPEAALESASSGAVPMNISGRLVWQRERCIGMTDAERQWRAQWLKDQILHDEPVIPENFYKERYNPIRRFYRAPMNKVESMMIPKLGLDGAKTVRHMISNIFIVMGISYGLYYWLKYNPGDWQRSSGARIHFSRHAIYPGDPNYPNVYHPKDDEFASYGFKNSPI